MNQTRFQQCRSGLKTPLLPVAMLLALFGCGKQSDIPSPPHSPPRPVTYDPQQAPAKDVDRTSMPAATLMRFM